MVESDNRLIRVLYINHASIIGGVEINLLDIMRCDTLGGFRPVGVVLPGEGPLAAEVQRLGVPLHFVSYHAFRWRNPVHYARTMVALVWYVWRLKADLIHLNHHWLTEFAVEAGRLTHRPVVCEVQNRLDGPTVKQLRPWLNRAAAVVAVSQAVCDPLVEGGVTRSKVHLISCGLPIPALAQGSQQPTLRTQYGFSGTGPLVGVMGRVVPEKGIEDFIVAAACVSQQMAAARFVVIGEDDRSGAYRVQLERRAQDLGLGSRIVFTGFRTDIPDVLRALDLVVLPSRSTMPEGLPLSVLEALMAGRIVVATRNSGVPEVVRDGVNGFLVDCDDVPGLAAAIERALRLPPSQRRQMEAAARESVRDRTIERQVQQLGDLYRSLLAERRRSPKAR